MAHSRQTVEKAFRIFRKNQSAYEAAKKMGVSRQTILQWKDKYEWEPRINKIRQKVLQKEAEDTLREEQDKIAEKKRLLEQYAKEDEDTLKILKAFKGICQDAIKIHSATPDESTLVIRSLKDATEALNNVVKLERLIKGDPTDYVMHSGTPVEEYSKSQRENQAKLEQLKEKIDALA
jgi:hypothetical protein